MLEEQITALISIRCKSESSGLVRLLSLLLFLFGSALCGLPFLLLLSALALALRPVQAWLGETTVVCIVNEQAVKVGEALASGLDGKSRQRRA